MPRPGLPRRLRHGEEATLVEHLGELRARLVISLIAVAAAMIFTYVFHGHLLHWLNQPLPDRYHDKLLTLSPAEPFTTSLLVSFWAALLIALPIVLWQLWAFLAPAFEEHRQRGILSVVFFATLLGLGGVAFAYWIVLPPAMRPTATKRNSSCPHSAARQRRSASRSGWWYALGGSGPRSPSKKSGNRSSVTSHRTRTSLRRKS